MVSLGESSPIEVHNSLRNSPGNSTGYSELSWQPPPPTTHREMDRRNGSTRNWNSISDSSPTKDKMIGWGFCLLRNSSTTTRFTLLLSTLLSSSTPDVSPKWASNQTSLGVRERSASSDVSSDISPSPLYIPPHRR